MNKVAGIFAALAFCIAGAVQAQGQLSSTKSVDINAPAAKVWALVKDFDGLHKWHPAFSDAKNTAGKNGQLGAVRAITLRDGPTFTEELLSYSDGDMSFSYRIVESPLPLDNYVSRMTVVSKGDNASSVVWRGWYIAKDKPDADVQGLIDGAYQAGVDNVKKMAESN